MASDFDPARRALLLLPTRQWWVFLLGLGSPAHLLVCAAERRVRSLCPLAPFFLSNSASAPSRLLLIRPVDRTETPALRFSD